VPPPSSAVALAAIAELCTSFMLHRKIVGEITCETHGKFHEPTDWWEADRQMAHIAKSDQARKKGRSGHERPKSREETPKEGYDTTSRARHVALQKLLVRRTIFKCIFCRAAPTETRGCIGLGIYH